MSRRQVIRVGIAGAVIVALASLERGNARAAASGGAGTPTLRPLAASDAVALEAQAARDGEVAVLERWAARTSDSGIGVAGACELVGGVGGKRRTLAFVVRPSGVIFAVDRAGDTVACLLQWRSDGYHVLAIDPPMGTVRESAQVTAVVRDAARVRTGPQAKNPVECALALAAVAASTYGCYVQKSQVARAALQMALIAVAANC